jgi:TPP-dependent pyruvate/acetoin dehydrogenase alpha subunit
MRRRSRYPRQATHSKVGVASLYAAAGTAVQARVALANDRIKIVLAQGGATKTGTFHFLVA